MKKTILSLCLLGLLSCSASQAETILVGTDAGLAPFEFKDPNSEEIVGFDMERKKTSAVLRSLLRCRLGDGHQGFQ